ncbi:hypothetical protein OQJ13_10075 [Legionella sp. PATHC035]|uniref:hypothetical protein n=1 Tax=Legionella sp. PATHC035 TaxID=2992040 RepID=UPI002243B8AC|nr:hypothetical protein [Legionella sp. PATHC035]MCW8409319.1 hypothetical protein [Legionella sp. PATHC035]
MLLNLENNGLGARSGSELAEILAAIPNHVDSLVLAENGLGRKSGAELAQAFKAIPISVSS